MLDDYMMFLREQQDIGEQNEGVRYRFDLWFSKVLAGFQLSGVGVTKARLKPLVPWLYGLCTDGALF